MIFRFIYFIILMQTILLADDVCISNFKKPLCGNFTVLNSVILKTKLSKEALINKINKPVQQIAILSNSNIYLIQTDNPLQYADELSKYKYTIYAQPNISQSRDKMSTLDIPVMYVQDSNTTLKGDGVNIAIIDDGFDFGHNDFMGTKKAFEIDIDDKRLSATPKSSYDTHGTEVLGIIFSNKFGIAPNANLIAIRQTTNITSDTIMAFYIAKKANAQIINCSWNSPILLEPIYDIIKDISQDTAIVFAAGNNHKKLTPQSIEASIPEVITVGATQKYSNYGEVVDFVLRGNVYTTKLNNEYGYLSGTSASAPIITGLLALKIQQYPNRHYTVLINQLQKELNVR